MPARWAGRKAKCFYAMAKAFLGVQLMGRRTVIERVNNLMKHVYGEPRLRRRGTAAAQAAVDKTLRAMHVVLETT